MPNQNFTKLSLSDIVCYTIKTGNYFQQQLIFLDIWIKVDQLWWNLLYYVNLLLNMFRMLIHPSSGACNYLVRYCVGCIVLTWGVLVLCSGIGCWWCGIRVQAEPSGVMKVGLPLFKYQDDARSNTHMIFLALFTCSRYSDDSSRWLQNKLPLYKPPNTFCSWQQLIKVTITFVIGEASTLYTNGAITGAFVTTVGQ